MASGSTRSSRRPVSVGALRDPLTGLTSSTLRNEDAPQCAGPSVHRDSTGRPVTSINSWSWVPVVGSQLPGASSKVRPAAGPGAETGIRTKQAPSNAMSVPRALGHRCRTYVRIIPVAWSARKPQVDADALLAQQRDARGAAATWQVGRGFASRFHGGPQTRSATRSAGNSTPGIGCGINPQAAKPSSLQASHRYTAIAPNGCSVGTRKVPAPSWRVSRR